MFWQNLVHITGVDQGVAYGHWVWMNFWSGFGSDLGEITIFAAVIGMFKKHNCHVKGCWRIGKFPLDGTPYIVCRKHHPDIPNKAESHEAMMAQYNGNGNGSQKESKVQEEAVV